MPASSNEFYECENLNCRLRFPGYAGHPKWNRCPICRSQIHLVAIVENMSEGENYTSIQTKWQIEALLDNIRSAWNVGSIFRTADGTGIKKIYLCGISPSPMDPKVNKTALGAEESIPWEMAKNGLDLAINLKTKGYALWALEEIPNAEPLFQIVQEPRNSPIVLIVGNELSGIDPGVLEISDKVISIPMLGKKKSYNVAVAFGIAACFLLYRQSVSQGSFSIFPST